ERKRTIYQIEGDRSYDRPRVTNRYIDIEDGLYFDKAIEIGEDLGRGNMLVDTIYAVSSVHNRFMRVYLDVDGLWPDPDFPRFPTAALVEGVGRAIQECEEFGEKYKDSIYFKQ